MSLGPVMRFGESWASHEVWGILGQSGGLVSLGPVRRFPESYLLLRLAVEIFMASLLDK